MGNRVQYIDIAKGILILVVVFHHIPQVGNRLLMLNSDSLNTFVSWNWLYATFFMPSFFIITGYFSDFEKECKSFILQNFKSLILAGVILSIVESILDTLLSRSLVISIDLRSRLISFIKYGTPYWFLSTLFLCKIFFYFLCKLTRYDVIKGMICMLTMCLALYICPEIDRNDSNNYWYFNHVLFYLFFLWLGSLMRRISILEWKFMPVLGWAYIAMAVVFCFLGIKPPVLTHYFGAVTYISLPLSLLLATTGTFLIFYFSRQIYISPIPDIWLQYVGKNSLIIYALHIAVVRNIGLYISHYIVLPDSMTHAWFYVMLSFFVSVLILVVVSKLLNVPQLRWIVGKW